MATRATLKDYFQKGAIPTEANFADLIDSMMIQEEDNIFARPNDPISIKAIGPDETLINFYRTSQGQDQLTWKISQNINNKNGLSIEDQVKSRLFLEANTGNIGINSTAPQAMLHIETNSDVSLTQHGALLIGSVTGVNMALDNNEIMARNNGNAAVLNFQVEGGEVRIHNALPVNRKVVIKDNGYVGIGVDTPGDPLTVAGPASLGLGTAPSHFPWRGNGWAYISGKGIIFRRNSADNLREFMRIGDNGNVGIATTRTNHTLNLPAGNHNVSLGDNIFINGQHSTGRITNNAYIENGRWAFANPAENASTIELRNSGRIEMYGNVTKGQVSWRQMFGIDAVNNKSYFANGNVSVDSGKFTVNKGDMAVGHTNPKSRLDVNGQICMRMQANNVNAKKFLGSMPINTILIGGTYNGHLYFYFKDNKGTILRHLLAGTKF